MLTTASVCSSNKGMSESDRTKLAGVEKELRDEVGRLKENLQKAKAVCQLRLHLSSARVRLM